MTDHLTKHRAAMAQEAWPVVQRFVQTHPQYTIAAGTAIKHRSTLELYNRV